MAPGRTQMTLRRRDLVVGAPVFVAAFSAAGCQIESQKSFAVKSSLETNAPESATVPLAAIGDGIILIDPNTVVRISDAIGSEARAGGVVLDATQRVFANGTAGDVAGTLGKFTVFIRLTAPSGASVYLNPRQILQVFEADPRVTNANARSFIRLTSGNQQVQESIRDIKNMISAALGVVL